MNEFQEKVMKEHLAKSPRDLTDDQVKAYAQEMIHGKYSFSDRVYFNLRLRQMNIGSNTTEVKNHVRDKLFPFYRTGSGGK